MSPASCAAQPELDSTCKCHELALYLVVPRISSYAAHLDMSVLLMPCLVRHDQAQTPCQSAAEVMSREHDLAAAAATQLTEQLALQQQQAAKRQLALKQVCNLSQRQLLCPTS